MTNWGLKMQHKLLFLKFLIFAKKRIENAKHIKKS